MKFLKHLAVAAAAFTMTAGPAIAADAKADQARAAVPVAQSEQLFGDEGGDSWIIFALLGLALAAGLFVALDDPASP